MATRRIGWGRRATNPRPLAAGLRRPAFPHILRRNGAVAGSPVRRCRRRVWVCRENNRIAGTRSIRAGRVCPVGTWLGFVQKYGLRRGAPRTYDRADFPKTHVNFVDEPLFRDGPMSERLEFPGPTPRVCRMRSGGRIPALLGGIVAERPVRRVPGISGSGGRHAGIG